MKKEKLIPIICIVVLLLIAAYIIASNSILSNVVKFEHFSYKTNNEKISKDDISIDDILVINNVTFMVIGVEGNRVVLNSSETYDDSSNEIIVNINEEKEVCFSDTNCITFSLT